MFGRTQSYHYDLLGNLTSRSDTLSGSATNYDVGTLQYEGVRNAGIHAVTTANGINYSYDAYGNMTQRGSETLQYNVFNKPTKITAGSTITNFTYNGEDELFKETTGTKSIYKLFGGVYDVTVNGTTRIEKSYVDGVILNTRTVVSGTQTQSETQYLHSDHLGSTEAITNALGQFVTRMSFSTWGERQTKDWAPGPLGTTELNNLNAITTNGYTGHDQIDQHNLIHMGGRVYDPNLGRFLSADLFVVDPYSANSFNRYTYVSNNPLGRVDPTGYWDRGSSDVLVIGQCASGSTCLTGSGAYNFSQAWQNYMDRAWAISAPYFVDYETRDQLRFLGTYTGDDTFNFMDDVDQDSADELKDLKDELDAKGYTNAVTLLGTVLTVAEMKNKKKNERESATNNNEKTTKPGEFSITDWSGYPANVPKPQGPFRLVEGAEYDAARRAANQANNQIRQANNLRGQPVDVHEIQPVKFGGSSTDPSNKIILDRTLHRQEVTPWWNQLQKDLGN